MMSRKKIQKLFSHPAFLLFLFNLIFLINPIIQSGYFAPTDWLMRFPSFSLDDFHVVKNSFLADPVTQFHPWYKYAADSLKSGNIPVWNDLNSGGVPFLGNAQSAVFFPLSIFFYIFSFKIALFLFHFFKLYLLGLFTYLYLRQIDIGKYESLFGAVGFNFALFNITWILWPQTNVLLLLPLQLLLIEKYLRDIFQAPKFIMLLGTSFAMSVFGGHNQTTFHVTLITVLYFLFRHNMEKNKIDKIKSFALSALLGIVLSAVHWLPFLEYLANSYVLVERGGRAIGTLMPLQSIIYSIFPNIGGNPSTDYYRPLFEHTSYNQGTGAYLGTIILLLSAFWLLFMKKKNRIMLFYFLVSLFVLPFIFNIPGLNRIGEWANIYASNTRLLFVIAFSQAVISAYALNRINKKKIPDKFYKYSLVLIPTISLILLAGIRFGVPLIFHDVRSAKLFGFTSYLSANVIFFGVSTLLGIFSIYKISRKKNNQKYFILLIVLLFLQTGVLNINYNPTIGDRYFYPNTKETILLQDLPEGNFLQLGGNYIIHPEVNMYYDIKMIENYDAIGVKQYKELYNAVFDQKEHWNGLISDTEQKYLDLFGIRYIGSYTDINNTLTVNQSQADEYLTGIKGNTLKTTFIASHDNLYAVRLLPANFNRNNDCYYQLTLYDHNEGIIGRNEYDCSKIYDKIYKQYNFEQQNNSKGSSFTLEIKHIDGFDDISFWVDQKGDLTLQSLYLKRSKPALDLIHEGRFNIFENTKYIGDFYFVKNAVYVHTEDMIEYLRSSEFDPHSQVVLEKEQQKIKFLDYKQSNTEIEVLEKSPTKYDLKVDVESSGYIVTTKSYYPGWKAKIDGEDVEVIRGNYAFSVIPVNVGEHQVSFYYDPISYKIGLISTLSGLLIVLGLLIKQRRLKSQDLK